VGPLGSVSGQHGEVLGNEAPFSIGQNTRDRVCGLLFSCHTMSQHVPTAEQNFYHAKSNAGGATRVSSRPPVVSGSCVYRSTSTYTNPLDSETLQNPYFSGCGGSCVPIQRVYDGEIITKCSWIASDQWIATRGTSTGRESAKPGITRSGRDFVTSTNAGTHSPLWNREGQVRGGWVLMPRRTRAIVAAVLVAGTPTVV
jgi:hypothetical protein